MVRDLVDAIARFGGNVEAMEVVSRFVYVRIHCVGQEIEKLKGDLTRIAGVYRIESIDSLPYEADERNLSKRANPTLNGQDDTSPFAGLIYQSNSMARLIHVARTVAKQDVPVLITGESGTGKELMARAIHQASKRNNQRFVPVNCAAIPDNLLDSELFGYVEGAFTGARRGGRLGLFEVADQGTLFLDEIGEMNPSVQAKLLRVLSEGEVRRVGDTVARKVNVRILAATNRNLEQLVQAGQFRADVYFRLNVIPIHIPPLRQRREDILPLAMAFVQTMQKRLERDFTIPQTTVDALLDYAFPGNVRELQNMVERACYLTEDSVLTSRVFMVTNGDDRDPNPIAADGESTVVKGVSGDMSLHEQVRRFEQDIIRDAVDKAGSIRKAARKLGVSHTTLLNKLKQ